MACEAEGFMRAATLELPCDIRVNVVSPPWDIETLMALKMDHSRGMLPHRSREPISQV